MSGTINRMTAISGVSSNLPLTDAITIVTAQPGGNVSTTQTITLIPTQPGSSRNLPPIKTITLVKGQPGTSVTLPPTEPEFTAELIPSSSHPLTETVAAVTAEAGQRGVSTWNFENLEEKNPLSELSEEHLNKLDEVLASADVQEILQQSVGSSMELEGEGNQLDSEPVELQESDLAVLSVAFTDHAYAVHPNKAPKSRPVMVTTASKPKPIVVTVGPNEVYEKPAVSLPSIPSVVPQSLEPPSPVIELYPSSPSSVESSPRKSGRASKAKRYGDEDWVTSSPRKGRGRGLLGAGTDSPPGYGNKRQSSRIEDQKQRELAEKILQANRQALEAEKLTGSAAESFLGGFDPVGVRVRAPGLGSRPEESDVEAEESDVDVEMEKVSWKGRGRGRGRGRGKKSSDDEKIVGKQSHDNLFDRLNDSATYDRLNESTVSSQLDTTLESDTEKTTDDVKTTEVSDGDSDAEKDDNDDDDDKDSVGDKIETVKKKPVKKRSMWDSKRRKKKKKAVKVKAKVTETETEGTMESDSEKSDVEDDEDVKDDSKTKVVSKKGKKVGKVKEKIKGKKDKGKSKKSKSKDDASEESDMGTDDKSKEKKTVKKLTKKERLKKLKEAKKAKKAKLLEKKKAKLKEKKLKKGKAGKGKDSAAESDKLPKKKKKGKETDSNIANVEKAKLTTKKKGIKDTDIESDSDTEEKASPKKSKKGQVATAASPVKKKKGKASVNEEEPKGKLLSKKKKLKASEETEESEGQGSPKKKKAKLAKEKADSPVKGKKGKPVEMETNEDSEVDQKKGKKKGKGKKDVTLVASPKKLGKQKEETIEDVKKSPTKAGKRKEAEETDSVPAKKQKLGKIDDKKKLREGIRSDSDDDVPLQKIKTDLQEENTPLNQIQKDLQAETKTSIIEMEVRDTAGLKTEKDTKSIEQTIEEQTNLCSKTEIENKASGSLIETVTADQSNEEIDVLTVDTDNNMAQESLIEKKDNVTDLSSIKAETDSQVVNVSDDKTVKDEKSVDKKDGKRRLSDDRDTSESRSKKRDSRDSSKDHRKHTSHHHRHSRDSREQSHDRKDSHKDRCSPSRRKDSYGGSKERRKSGSLDKDRHRTESHERKSSVSKDGKDSKKPLKRDERQSSVGGPNSEKKKVKTPGKVEKKKSRKSMDERVDSLWTDLFTPDVTPSQKGKLKKESSIDNSGVVTKKTIVTEAKGEKSKAVSEKEDSVSSLDSALNKTENKDKVEDDSVDRSDTSIFDKFKDMEKIVDNWRSDKMKAKEAETDKVDNKMLLEKDESKTIKEQENNESKSIEKQEITSETKEVVSNVVDDLKSACQKTEIKDEKRVSSNEVKIDQNTVKDEKVIKTEQKTIKDEKVIKMEQKAIKDEKVTKIEQQTKDGKLIKSEQKSIKDEKSIKTEQKTKREEKDKKLDSKKKDNKDAVSREIKKEKESYDKEKLKKKLKDKARRMKEKLIESSEKEKKGYKKEKLLNKPERSRSLSSDKGRKLSPDKNVNVIKISPLKKDVLEKHRKLSEEGARKRQLSGEGGKPEHGPGEGKSRPTRNKAVAFAEILKKEKLGSDDNEEGSEDDSDYNDDEADETWEDPGKLYCLCRQPHNKRFMICCDKCEEWFHGKCVGISRSRGEEMEKNDEEYICPQCSEREVETVDSKAVVTSTESPDQSHKKAESKTGESKESVSLSDSMEVSSSHEGVEKSDSQELPRPDSTVSSPIKRDSLDTQSPRTHPAGDHTPHTPVTPTTPHTPVTPTTPHTPVTPTTPHTPVTPTTPHTPVTPTTPHTPATPTTPHTLVTPTTPHTPATPTTPHTPTTPTRVRHDSGSPRKLKSPDGEGGKGYIRKRSSKDVSPAEKKKRIKTFKPERPTIMFSQRKCLCGCNRLARVDSLFWGKECELRNEELRREEEQAEAARKAAEAEKKLPQEKRVAVVEKGTGKTLTGHKAPRESELKDWLQRHPTFEVLKSHRRLPSKDSSRDRASDSSEVSDREKSADDSLTEKPLPRGPEPVRLNVRKGLRDALAARADAADDIVLANSEIKGLALTIEEEMFKCFKDTDHKYKAKYRSLVFNIKDHKNKGLFRKILNRRIRPYQLVRMTPEELASQELSKWREHETKHQLEMIEQTEEALLHEHPHITKKTHKGEEEVEAEGEEDLSSLSTTEPKKEEAPVKIDPKADVLSSILPDTTDQHGKHLFDSNCSVCTGKIVPHPESSETSKTTVVHEEPKPQEVEPEPTQKEKDRQAQEVVKEVLKAIKLAQAEADREKAEAQKRASSVTVRSPDSALSSGLEKKAKFEPKGPQLWKGFVYMQDVSKFVTSAYRVTGPADHLDMPDTIHVCGRINPEHVWDYLSKIKQAASRDICVIRFIPGNNEEKAAYINLYSYLNSRSRCGVVQNSAKHIKDFYIVPLPSHSRIPSVLKPFDGPGLEENRCHMLIGVIIRNKTRPGGSGTGMSGHHHKQDPRKLKSNLKDPAPEEKAASSSSSSPTSSASSVTPQEKKKKKAKSISFDPIVKEYSHVPSDQEATPDVSYDPSAPYDPEKEAETTTPKQEDRPYSPGQEELFGLAESLKTSHKHKSKDDPVSKMIEKIALSKNPVEATATMVAALATSSRLGNQNQRKLLLELTKKVDEQKKALEKKRLLAASGKSPSSMASPSEKSGVIDDIGSTSTGSPHSSKTHVNRNDPRLMPKKTVETNEVKDSSLTEISSDSSTSQGVSGVSLTAGPAVYSPLKDLQASRAAQAAAQQQAVAKSDSGEAKTDTKDNVLTSSTVKPFSFTVKSKAHPVSKSVIEDEDDYDENKHHKLPKLEEDEIETVFKPKGFYVDHGEKASPDQEEASALVDSLKSSVQDSQENLVENEHKTEDVASETMVAKDTETTEIALGSKESVTKESNVGERDKVKVSAESVEDKDKLNVTDTTVNVSKAEKVHSSDFDIISHLQAEVSGTVKSDTVIPKSLQMLGLQKEKESKEKEGKEALNILSQLHASVWGSKSNKEPSKEAGQSGDKIESGAKSSQLQTDTGQSPVKLPQNILNILKEVTDKPGTKTQAKSQESQQQSGQLPKSLLSLFSGIPSGSKSASDSKVVSSADEDLRLQAMTAGNETALKKPVNPSLEAKPEIKVTKEKLSKSLLAFDYDSDSDSEGSFEGFDDDGLKSLSPRKRKLVAKQSPARADTVRDPLNEFGDVDIRVPIKQTDISKQTTEDTFGFPAEDIDLRQKIEPTDIDERVTLDEDERVQSSAEFLPPGEELEVSEFPADVDERIKKPAATGVIFSTPGVVFTTPDAIPIRPPPLHDVDHRRMPFPPPGPIPPGMRPLLPFMGSNQPPPPGEDWQPGQPAPPPLPLFPAGEPPPLPKEVPKEVLPPLPEKPPKDEVDKNETDKTKTDEKDRDEKASEDSKDKADDSRTSKDKKGKKKKKDKKEKKKGELMASDEILKARVLEIARNEPIEPPPLPPILNPPVPVPMPGYSGPPQMAAPQMAVSSSMPGPAPLSGPPPISGQAPAMMSMQGPVLSQPPGSSSGPTPQPQNSFSVSSQNMTYPSQGPSRPFPTSEGPQMLPKGKKWQGPSERQPMPQQTQKWQGQPEGPSSLPKHKQWHGPQEGPQLPPQAKKWQGPQEGPQLPPQAKKWQGPPARASPGPAPPSLFDIEVKPTKRLVLPSDGRSPSPSPLQPIPPPSKQDGLLATPDLPPNHQGSILGPGQFSRPSQNLPPGPNTVSSLGSNPFTHHDESRGPPGHMEGDAPFQPHLPHGSEDYGDDRGSWDRGQRDSYRDRHDRHSSRERRERDGDRHRHDHHRDDHHRGDQDYRVDRDYREDRDYRSNRDRHDRSERHSSERYNRDTDRHDRSERHSSERFSRDNDRQQRSDRHSSERQGRDYDRNRDDYRSDRRSSDRHHDDDSHRDDRHRNRGRDDYDRHNHRSRR